MQVLEHRHYRSLAVFGVVAQVALQVLAQGTGKIPAGVGAVTGADQRHRDVAVGEQRIAAAGRVCQTGLVLLQLVGFGQQLLE
ncbi:hypothetical protein D3C85_1002490 [compost metagenome]